MPESRFAPLSMLALVALAPLTMSSRSATSRQSPDPAPYRVLVTGEVRYPGRVTLTESTMTVPDALAAVGSPTANAGDEVVVIHPPAPGAAPERLTIAVKDIDTGRPGVDLRLRDGDIVNVPAVQHFFISGFVRLPGAYKLHPGMTVSQAIALVGGLFNGGSDRRIRIRRTVNGKMVESAAQLDDAVRANDEIKVQRTMF